MAVFVLFDIKMNLFIDSNQQKIYRHLPTLTYAIDACSCLETVFNTQLQVTLAAETLDWKNINKLRKTI